MPAAVEFGPHQRNAVQPGEIRQRQVAAANGANNRATRIHQAIYQQGNRNDKQQEQQERHDQHGEPATAEQQLLQAQQQRPRGHDNGRCPRKAENKGLNNPQTRNNHEGQKQHRQQNLRNIPGLAKIDHK